MGRGRTFSPQFQADPQRRKGELTLARSKGGKRSESEPYTKPRNGLAKKSALDREEQNSQIKKMPRGRENLLGYKRLRNWGKFLRENLRERGKRTKSRNAMCNGTIWIMPRKDGQKSPPRSALRGKEPGIGGKEPIRSKTLHRLQDTTPVRTIALTGGVKKYMA